MSVALGKVCNACGVERKKKGVLYDTDQFMPYCENPYICNDKHPNSPRNLVERGEELKLIPLLDAEEKFKVWVSLNHPNKEKAEKIKRMVRQPITLRVGSPDLAQFILDLQDEFNFSSVSDTIRYCIQTMRENHGVYYKDYKELDEEKQEKELVENTEKEVQQELEEKPKPSPVQEQEQDDDEEELVF